MFAMNARVVHKFKIGWVIGKGTFTIPNSFHATTPHAPTTSTTNTFAHSVYCSCNALRSVARGRRVLFVVRQTRCVAVLFEPTVAMNWKEPFASARMHAFLQKHQFIVWPTGADVLATRSGTSLRQCSRACVRLHAFPVADTHNKHKKTASCINVSRSHVAFVLELETCVHVFSIVHCVLPAYVFVCLVCTGGVERRRRVTGSGIRQQWPDVTSELDVDRGCGGECVYSITRFSSWSTAWLSVIRGPVEYQHIIVVLLTESQ